MVDLAGLRKENPRSVFGTRTLGASSSERSEAAGCRMVLAGMIRHASQNNPLRLRKLRYGDFTPIVLWLNGQDGLMELLV
jgi:hypothetical protein